MKNLIFKCKATGERYERVEVDLDSCLLCDSEKFGISCGRGSFENFPSCLSFGGKRATHYVFQKLEDKK